MTRSPCLVLFDFDYTLVDSSRGIVECTNSALRRMGFDEAPAASIHAVIGYSLPEMLVRLKGEATAPRGEEFQGFYSERSNEVLADLTVFYPWVPQTLASLRDQGFSLGIVSTKKRHRIVELLDREGLQEEFVVVVGGEDVRAHKPAPEGLRRAIEKTASSLRSSVYVGDSVVDGEAAQRAGVPFIGVLSGATDSEDLDRFPSIAILGSAAEVPEFLGRWDGAVSWTHRFE